MNGDETRAVLNRAKFCIAHKIVVSLQWGEYFPVALILRRIKDEWIYSVELHDVNRINSLITIGLYDIEWPDTGGGYTCIS